MIERHTGDCRSVLPTLPNCSVNCCVTSPPYFGLRSYLGEGDRAKDREIGLEATPQHYVETLVAVFREVWRVLCNDGTLWLNLGDSYAKKSYSPTETDLFSQCRDVVNAPVRPGDLVGIPWRVCFALQADGWHVRGENIWDKPNAMPEGGLTNRPSRAHEHVFLLTKRQSGYYYDIDATREPVTSTGGACFGKQRHSTEGTGAQSRKLSSPSQRNHPLGKNKRSVWRVPVRSFSGAHFAIFPAELIEPCILAGCPKDGKVLDPFAGRGTTGVVAEALERDAVLIELSPVYVEMQKERATIERILKERKRRQSRRPQSDEKS